MVPRVVVLVQERHLLDRNMVVMIKDTLAARFCTKLSQLDTEGLKSPLVRVEKLTQFYQLGDKIMTRRRNDVFDVLQLLEPQCNQQLVDLAPCTRPKIPRSTKFQDILEQEIAKLDEDPRGEVSPLFQHIQAEGD